MSNQILTYNHRIQIEKYIHEGMPYRKMGKLLNLNFSTIWREIARNGGRKNYDPYKADISTFHSRQASDLYNKQEKLVNDLETQQRVLSYLEQKLAPQVMVGRAKKERHPLPVSHQTIYNFIYQHKRNWISYLPYRKSRKYNYRKSRKNIAHVTKTNISQIFVIGKNQPINEAR